MIECAYETEWVEFSPIFIVVMRWKSSWKPLQTNNNRSINAVWECETELVKVKYL